MPRAVGADRRRAQRRCRVIAGTATVTDGVEKPALMAGAANVTLFPFTPGVFESELDRLEERLGPRKTAVAGPDAPRRARVARQKLVGSLPHGAASRRSGAMSLGVCVAWRT